MFLKSLDLYGFKSFADRTHIDFVDGITALLGPNGCGKSNIVDAIRWVLGEQSMKTIRAGRKEDVIFNGTDKRKPMTFAEVTLVIDNSEHVLPSDLTEIAIRRRVFRTGESEYYLNGKHCLLRNISELFYDTGVGKTAYSILEQGKIDQVLSNKPEDRRYIFEEAAGISRYKQQCNEAQNKLQRTEENIKDIETHASQAKRSCDRNRGQAEKAQKARELNKKAFDLDVQFHLGRLRTYALMNEQRTKLIEEGTRRVEELRAEISVLTARIEEAQTRYSEEQRSLLQLQLANTKLEGSIQSVTTEITNLDELYRNHAATERSASDRAADARREIERAKEEKEEYELSIQDKLDKLEEEERKLKGLEALLEKNSQEILALEAVISGKEREIDERNEELASLSEELKAAIEDLAGEIDAKTGTEYSQERRDRALEEFTSLCKEMTRLLENRIAFLRSLGDDIAPDKEMTVSDYERLEEGLELMSLAFSEYVDSIPPVLDTLLSDEGLAGKKRLVASREAEVRSAISGARMILNDSRERQTLLRKDTESLRGARDLANSGYIQTKAAVDSANEVLSSLSLRVSEKEASLDTVLSDALKARKAMADIQERIRDAEVRREELRTTYSAQEEQYKEKSRAISAKSDELNRLREEKDLKMKELQETQNAVAQNKGYQDSSQALVEDTRTSFFNKYSRSLGEFEEEYRDKEIPSETLVQNEYNETKKELESLGNINWMAESDYKDALEQYKFYDKHLKDLEKAREDLAKVLEEITSRSEELFSKTYKEISAAFQSLFTRLFGGGKAEITLDDPENVLTSGIDIVAQPPGKKPQFLGQLSGGERTMTAVALLFATYQVKPSPFCILDELDAALDDKNVGNFLSVLDDFSQSSQFIIITHNKHTVTGAESLLGVTQMEAGVSATVSYRLESIKGEPVILNAENKEITID